MSRTWVRVSLRTSCGFCGGLIEMGAPALVVAGEGWKKFRCGTCAGEPVPSVIQERPEPLRFPSARPLATMAADWKHKQAGDR